MVEDAGGAFFLVHVATPLEECERRDRKGLYAKARAGEIPEFTGISSPYEAPEDADVRVDTTGRTIPDALDDVIVALQEAGYLDLPLSTPDRWSSSDERQRGAGVETTDKPPVEEARQRRLGTEAPETTQAPDEPLKVLFVCTANICRSPFMELTARHLAGDAAIEFRSAGTHGFSDHPMNPEMAVTLEPRGVTGEQDFRSRPLTKAELDWADVVLTAEADPRRARGPPRPRAPRSGRRTPRDGVPRPGRG